VEFEEEGIAELFMDDTAIADVASEGKQTLTVDNLSRGSHIHVACRSVYDWDQES